MRVIINADDFGLNTDVNDRIIELMSRRCIASATLIENAPAVEEAVRSVPRGRNCSIGVHINLAELPPLASLSSNSKCNTSSPDGLQCCHANEVLRQMNAEDRETLTLGLARGHSLKTMALVLKRAPCTVSRELAHNVTRGQPYRACTAHTLATGWACQPRRRRKLLDPWLWQYVRTYLGQDCSPEQIAGHLQRAYPDDMSKQLSPETIYAALYVLPCGTLRSALLAALRQARKALRPRARGTDRHGQIPNMTPIAERPAEVATRTVPGHWAGDLIKGARNGSAVGTLVERTTRLVILQDGRDGR